MSVETQGISAQLRLPLQRTVDLVPSMLYGRDMHGWSGDGAISQGRNLAALSLRANFKSGFVGDITWLPTWGGTYNNQRDRSALQLVVGQRF